MSVVDHSHGWLGRGREGVVVGRHARQSQDGLIACRVMPEHFPCARREHS